MEISFNIKDLLQKNDQVVLPGLGAFYKNRIEGFFDEAKNTFFPPKETIEFTSSQANHPSGSNPLISFISRSKNVSTTTAAYLLDKQVEEFKKNLNETGEVNFEDIGKLKLRGTEIIFEAEESEKTCHSFFGLPAFTLPNTELDNTAQEPETNFTLAEQALSTAVSDEELLESKPKSRIWLYILLSIIIVALSLSTLYLLRPDIFSSFLNIYHQPKIKNTVPVTIPEDREKEIADSIYNSNNIAQSLEANGFEVENIKDTAKITVDKKIVPNKSNIRYEIIIAAWKTRPKAEAHLKKLKESGIDAHIVDDAEGTYYKISAATLYNQQDAEVELNRIKKELNPEALIKPIKTLK